MYAIVEIAGQQFKVEEGKKIFVHRLELGGVEKIVFDKVLLIEDNGRVIIGEPVIKDAVVEGKVLEHVRGDKIIVFKKKRRKGYRVKNGHRQNFTYVEIVNISEKGSIKKATPKKEEKVVTETKASEEAVKDQKPTEKKTAARKPSVKKAEKEKAPAKKTTVRKPAEKKPVQKKTTAKKPSKGKA